TRRADLVLHVVDASAEDEDMLEMVSAVEQTLDQIGAGERPRVLVLNKLDAVTADRRAELAAQHPDAVLISAAAHEGLENLMERIAREFAKTLRSVELLLPFDEGAKLAELHEIAGDLHREDTSEGVRVVVRLPSAVADRFEPFAVRS
ncbi:MAG TPA: hypothetical protein PKB03_07390, partial [Baekduia sp.]|nr:hypothetical protein [Baekduia sp.]